jgi:hypothetical protein
MERRDGVDYRFLASIQISHNVVISILNNTAIILILILMKLTKTVPQLHP